MKYSAVLSIFILFACGCNRNNVRTKLLSEQGILKDSANNITERIGGYMHKAIIEQALKMGRLVGSRAKEC